MSKKPLPLERKDSVEADQASGATVRRTVYTRGLLKSETNQYDNLFAGLAAAKTMDPRRKFEDLLVRARAILREVQLPTDEDTGEILLPDGRIVRPIGQVKAQDLAVGFSFKDWSQIVKENTEPLSRERAAVALIKEINAILQKNLDQATLKHIWCLMQATHRFEMLIAGINQLAVSAHEAEKARKKGPEAQAAKGIRVEAIVRELATEYWKRVPLHRKNMAQTVEGIISDLTTRLKDERLKPIERSQITSYLRGIVRDSAEQEG
ncbi:hypothetical protein MAE02_69190 [Microvirga aerophila]|uniref:Uncharacterized protein n=2 Tax=Microvirga aerophila TaxID=670291 RepID=A0A512C4R3_9HYPH|nr:hypothetical protein MAE02_69190 [Microvirga aerophila]